MKTRFILLTTVATLALSAPAFAVDKESYESKTKISKDANGNYKEDTKVEDTDTAGTTVKNEKKVKVDVDANGNVKTTTKVKESTDPKGLMNKTTAKTTDVEKASKDGTVETSHKKVVDGKTVENTSDTTKQ